MDVRSLLTCVADVAHGDVSQEGRAYYFACNGAYYALSLPFSYAPVVLLSCFPCCNLALCFVADELFCCPATTDVDPRLRKALHMAQLNVQYLLSCRDLMKEKQNIIDDAMHTFEEEENLLDFKLAKLK